MIIIGAVHPAAGLRALPGGRDLRPEAHQGPALALSLSVSVCIHLSLYAYIYI